jgi:hypothetical protein
MKQQRGFDRTPVKIKLAAIEDKVKKSNGCIRDEKNDRKRR